MLRSSNINFTVTGSTKGFIGTMTIGEGLLQIFEGSGMIWLAPTLPMCNMLSYYGVSGVTNLSGAMNNTQ